MIACIITRTIFISGRAEARITTHGQKGGASRGCKENNKSN